jgi:predicted LPLAT superfamily acyltransferase
VKDDNSHHSWHGKSRGGATGYRIFIFFIRYFGLRFAYFILAFTVIYFIPFAPSATRSLWFYYRRILRRSILVTPLLIYKHYFVFGQTIIDKIAVKTIFAAANGVNDSDSGGEHRTCGRFKFDIPQYKEFIDLVDKGTGFITIGAHVGCWELVSCFFNGYEDKINIVMLDAEYQKIKDVFSGRKRPYKIIPVVGNDATPDDFLQTILEIRSALERNEMVSFQGDRFVSGTPTFTASFLGASAHFPAGAFILASKMRVPVVFLFVVRQRKFTYRIEFAFVDTANRNTDKSLEEAYVSTLENIVRRYPAQWFNFYRFWD